MESRTTVLHYPRLDTVLMIEGAIKNGFGKKGETYDQIINKLVDLWQKKKK